MTKRKPARRISEVPVHILEQLNRGEIEAGNLVEGLAINSAVLFANVFSDITPLEATELNSAKGILKKSQAAAGFMTKRMGPKAAKHFVKHPSDTVRGWAAITVGIIENVSLKERLRRIHPYADDSHFGVREWAWMSLRPHLARELDLCIELLGPWTQASSPNLRRFAVESTRPRGVWCAHIPQLRQNPSLGLPLLEPLAADESIYVQNSVANWLNDASKDHPDWVKNRCQIWGRKHLSPATTRICKRALRNIT